MKMNKELEIFATTLNEIVKDIPDSFWLYSIETESFVNRLIEENKEYEYIYDEDNEIQDKSFKGYKDEKLNKVLEKIKKSLEEDEKRRDKDKEELKAKVFSRINSVRKIIKLYAINTEEKK
nr:MAG TPA: hypothetical protein [Caudoviricetes sp.]